MKIRITAFALLATTAAAVPLGTDATKAASKSSTITTRPNIPTTSSSSFTPTKIKTWFLREETTSSSSATIKPLPTVSILPFPGFPSIQPKTPGESRTRTPHPPSSPLATSGPPGMEACIMPYGCRNEDKHDATAATAAFEHDDPEPTEIWDYIKSLRSTASSSSPKPTAVGPPLTTKAGSSSSSSTKTTKLLFEA